MGVDGIGSSGRPLGGASPVEPGATAGAASASGAARTDVAAGASGSSALQRLERGEIDVETYLDDRVAEATSHLEKSLPASELSFVREALRAEMASDPVLIELSRRVTSAITPLKAG